MYTLALGLVLHIRQIHPAHVTYITYLYMLEHPDIACNGFKAAGIADIVSL